MKKLIKNQTKIIRSLSTLTILLTGLVLGAQNKTPDYWKCNNRISGKWIFGIAPAACDGSSFGEDKYVYDTYKPAIFSETKEITAERKRFMTELNALILESSERYILKRNPNVSKLEILNFQHASLAIAHQESYWTHYRLSTDSRIKLMRGDSGHGHGMMQVDDRWHFVAINKGYGWSLVQNIVYSLEEYYNAWEKAKTTSCVRSATDFKSIARSAYSAYNGGISKICRWTNANDKWAPNDQGFLQKYDQQSWQPYISDVNKISQINTECLIEGNENCPLKDSGTPPPIDPKTPLTNSFYKTTSDEYCVFKDAQFNCVEGLRDVSCLQNLNSLTDLKIVDMTPAFENSYHKNVLDRHDLCVQKIPSHLYRIGEIIKMKTDLNLRATPSGILLLQIPSGNVLQISDFEVRDPKSLLRYYEVTYQGKKGYVYAGDITNYQNWVTKEDQLKPLYQFISRPLGKILVKSQNGINLRDKLGGTVLTTIPVNTTLTVNSYEISTNDNVLYYKLTYKNQTGYIYGGRGLPDFSYPQWAEVSSK
jgi:hypothetical protein